MINLVFVCLFILLSLFCGSALGALQAQQEVIKMARFERQVMHWEGTWFFTGSRAERQLVIHVCLLFENAEINHL